MNLLDIRTEIRRILAETTTASSYFSDADITKFINDGINILRECFYTALKELNK
jgi:hypothetical protein